MGFDAEISTESTQRMQVVNQDMHQQQKQSFRFRWIVLGQDHDKNWLLSQQVEGCQLDIAVGAQRVRLANFCQALVGTQFSVTLSPQLSVVKIEGRDRLVNRLMKLTCRRRSC